MKKSLIMFFAGLVMAPGALFADCNSPITLGFDGSQKYDDDEFLYMDKYQHDLSAAGYTNTGKQTSGDGKGFECDKIKSASCTDNSVIELPAGHVWQGEVINEKRKYQCLARGMGNDKWSVVSNNVCTTRAFGDVPVGGKVGKVLTKIDCSGYPLSDHNGVEFEGVCLEGPSFMCRATKCISGMTAENGVCKIVTPQGGASTGLVCKTGTKAGDVPADTISTMLLTAAECTAAGISLSDSNGVEFQVWCNTIGLGATAQARAHCVAIKCKDGFKIDDGEYKGKCIPDQGGVTPPAPVVPPVNPKKTCRESRAGNPDGMACCDLASSVATWNGTACVCTDTNLEFKNDNGRGTCVAKQGTPIDPTFTCPDAADAELIAAWKQKCSGNADVLAKIAELEEYCRGVQKHQSVYIGMRETVRDWVVTMCNAGGNINITINQNQDILAKQKQQQQLQQQNINIKTQRINNLENELNTMAGQFETTVWRDAEGKFNTARLASDSIAAVVLGTTGGVVTSTVMKKKQVESGFEEIQCTIGGQVVATWGDQFSVGIQ